jgi:type IV secretion system protein VirD4
MTGFSFSQSGLHGSARWGTRKDLIARGYDGRGRFVLGYLPGQRRDGFAWSPWTRTTAFPVTYSGARHLLTIAPNRSGKGVCTCIPALLSHPGPAVVIDPRGEIAAATARFRREELGQRVAIYDPFDEICASLGRTPDAFNPLDTLDPHSPAFFDDATLLATALVIRDTHGSPFWSDEAQAFITGIILQVAADPREAKHRHLGRVRDVLNMTPEAFHAFVAGETDKAGALIRPGMAQSPHKLVRAAAGRILAKPERQFGDVLGTAQQNTHVLEGGAVQESLAASHFSFSDLTAGGGLTVYIVLNTDRLMTHGRLLRLLVTAAINAVNRMERKPEPSVLFMLDEMAALGHLDTLVNAFGMLAGSGMQLHPIFQDFAQLQSIYRQQWQTFIANAGVLQAFGTTDKGSAEYLSHKCGITTAEKLSAETLMRRSELFADPRDLGPSDMLVQRPLITPDEVMNLHPTAQLLMPASARPVVAFKAPYYLDARFRRPDGAPLFDQPPAYAGRALPEPVEFTRPGLDLFAALEPFLTVG